MDKSIPIGGDELPYLPANTYDPTSVQARTVHPVRWRTSVYTILVQLTACAVLIGWLAAAIWLWKNSIFLPLTYWDDSPYSVKGYTLLANGGYK
jgi:hypothetical protein